MDSTGVAPLPLYRKGLPATIAITILFLSLVSFFAYGQGGFKDRRTAILNLAALAFSSLILFLIFHTGRVHRWRRVYFCTYAIAFAISFVWWTMGDRGHMWLLDQEVLYSQAPMCHIVVPMLILPILFKKELIFPTAFAGASFMILLVGVVSLIYGRGFCSWGCFFGGQDELFSSLAKTRRWKIRNINPYVRYFSFGLLAFIVLHSFATLTPTYCFWFCPFKGTSEFIEVNSFIRVIQTFIFVSLWVLLAIFLPLLSKKRTQCGLFCPMGAFLSCTGKINLFGVRIDKSICRQCNRCIDACPTFALTPESLEQGKPLITCSKCGACFDSCPDGAIAFSIPGVPFLAASRSGKEPAVARTFWHALGQDLWDPGTVFIFGIFLLSTVMASSYLIDSTSRLLRYFFGI